MNLFHLNQIEKFSIQNNLFMKKNYKIVVVGLGYVGLSNAVLLAQHNEVIGVDISQDRVDALNARRAPIIDAELSQYLAEKDLNLSASTDLQASLDGAEYVIVATPTNYDEESNFLDTSSVEAVITQVIDSKHNTCIVVKSTIPVGFIEDVRKRLNTDLVIFSPEFLREGRALYDNLYPSRIIVGEKSQRAEVFASLLSQGALKKNVDLLFTGPQEAEAIKLFSNTYLAMRIAFFNELDSFAMTKMLNSREIIEGVSLDPRVGSHYNNPSFGYGGYCLPKDTKQLLASYGETPQELIRATIQSNHTRKISLAASILKSNTHTIGVYKLEMKAGSDNFREAAILSLCELLNLSGSEIIIYEPLIDAPEFMGYAIERDFDDFKIRSDIIITNRYDSQLDTVMHKVFTRDVYGTD